MKGQLYQIVLLCNLAVATSFQARCWSTTKDQVADILSKLTPEHCCTVVGSRSRHQIFRLNAGWKQDEETYEVLRPETSFGSESVPVEQRPINEYLDVTSQPFFGWAATGTRGLLTRLAILYGLIFGVVCYPISGATFTEEGYLLQKLAASNVGAMAVIFILLIRLFSGWGYIGQRLSSRVIEYEETGWYDGDLEEKTETEMLRDRMLYNSEVKPVVDRLKAFLLGSGGLFLASIISFNVILSANPVFNQYDPSILERLTYDDRLADSAALNSGGKPAYCDSRYYRAVANGGMGCN